MLGLVALFLIGALVSAPRIEAEVRQEVANRFDGAGVRATQVTSDGQGIAVQVEAAAKDEAFLHALAKSTQCDTWAGQLTCPTSASISLHETKAAPALLEHRAHPFTIARTGNAVTLTGEVPNLVERDRILGMAGQHFDIVNNELKISNNAASPAYSRAADQALAVVSHLNGGQAVWSGAALSVNGVANSGSIANAQQQFSALGSGRILGEFDVRSDNDLSIGDTASSHQSCNEQFGDIMRNATVRFRTGSAVIDDGNEDLLNRLADTARACPGQLKIAGHTDSRGDATMNEALSLARATAVRDALARLGVQSERLTAIGVGEAQPIDDNETNAGRARNRRIELTVE